jgi:hypothetical protein
MRDPDAEYCVHEFVREALQVRITPMMLVSRPLISLSKEL